MQEGFHWDSLGANENLTSQGVYLHDADRLAVWGDIDKVLSIDNGRISSNKVSIIGAPRYDNLFKTKKKSGSYVLLASSADPQPEEVEGQAGGTGSSVVLRALPRADAFAYIAKEDLRPILALRECDSCTGTG